LAFVVVVAFEVIFFKVLPDVLAFVFPLEAAARADFPAEAERPVDFFAVELLAAAVFVAPLLALLLAARLAGALALAAEPLARAAAVEAVADDFLSAFLLEGIRGLLLMLSRCGDGTVAAADESRMPPAAEPRHREGGMRKPC
jgi:hypothetical protein